VSDPEYFHHFAEMALKHPNFYGDNSAFNIPIRSRVIPKCVESPLCDKMLHGSDYPVPIFGHWAWMRGLIDWPTFRKWQKHPNPLERDYQLKRAVGFGESTFTRVANLLPTRVATSRSQSPAILTPFSNEA
jgi:uncharacterized protein